MEKDTLFRPAPFWFLNHKLEKEELEWQLEKMKEQGIGGVVFHARHGLKTPYLSEDWFSSLRVVVEKAKKLGMVVWLYDEDNWPSGPAGGRLTQDARCRMKLIRLEREKEVEGGKEIEIELPENTHLVLGVPCEEEKKPLLSQGLELYPEKPEEKKIRWRVPKKPPCWKVFIFTLRDKTSISFFGGYYLDLLSEEVVRKFIECTHLEYVRRFGKEMGETIAGIFTDEPACFYGDFGKEQTYTPSLFKEFRRRKKYDLKKYLPCLFQDFGKEGEKVRIDYYEILRFLYARAFYRQIYEVCERYGIKSIGHMLFEGELTQQIKYQIDFFSLTRWMHWAGVDFLTKAYGFTNREELDNLVGPKLASSSAHLLGKERVMSETFGLIGWNYDLSTLKKLFDWQIALGVNYFIPHAFYYSIQGFRKGECPPDEFWRLPFYPFYHKLSGYMKEVSSLFSGGKHSSQVAVLYPNRSFWAKLFPGNEKNLKENLEKIFDKVSELLLRWHYEYDYLSEEILQEGKIKEGKFFAGVKGKEEEFELVLLPGCTHLSPQTIEKLKEISSGGVKICLVGCGEKVKKALSSLKGVEVVEEFEKSALEKFFPPRLRIEPEEEKIVSYTYLKEGETFYFLFNTEEKERKVKISFPGIPNPLEFTFAPLEAKTLREKEIKKTPLPRENLKSLEISFPEKWDFKLLSPNAFPLREWRLSFRVRERETGSMRYSHIYETDFQVKSLPGKVWLLVDGLKGESVWKNTEKHVQIILNGKEIKEFEKSDFLDHYLFKAEVTPFLREGKNELRIESFEELYEASPLTDPLYLIGNFSLEANSIQEVKKEIPTGDLAQQGYPYLSGRVLYTQKIEIPSFKKVILKFPRVKNAVRVWVNQKEAGIVCWSPWEIDLTSFLREGENEVSLEVANTLANLIAQKVLPFGLLESPRLLIFK